MRSLITFMLSFVFIMGLNASDTVKSIISVNGMKDKSCVEKITKEINKLDGVKNVTVDLESGQVTIEHEKVNIATLNAAINNAGYKTTHDKSIKVHEINSEEKSCPEMEKAGCNKPCGRN